MANKLIVALDTDITQAKRLIDTLGDTVDIYKVHWLYDKHHEIVDYLHQKGKKVFLDFKIFDIPSTMGHRVAELGHKCDYITYHCLAGKDGIKTVLENTSNIVAIGVTVLTSFSDKDLKEVGIVHSAAEQSFNLVSMAYSVGARHFVCSPLEVKSLKTAFPDIILYVPGVQVNMLQNDQQRTGLPQEVFADGGDFVIMGRAVLEAEDPLGLVKNLY
jgi:orotidine-5'-phosphate decarboxylase